MHKYRLVAKKGEGTFSEVLKAQCIKNGKYMAIKCMKSSFDSLDQVNNLREIQALRRLSPHPNIIKLLEVLYDQPTGRLALVFELMDMNIYELIRGRTHYVPEERVKRYMYQLIRAMDHMHKNGIFHRDIKPENILIIDDVLKLADFGSCRGIYSKQPYTEYISTRWYRAPECLLTDGYYTHKMDMWGVGCVLFEVVSLFPLFPGTNEVDQIERIHATMGTPPQEVLAQFKKRSAHANFDFPPREGTGIAKLIPHFSPEGIDLIMKLLIYNPEERLSAKQALRHPYFRELREEEKRQAAALSPGLTPSLGPSPSAMPPPVKQRSSGNLSARRRSHRETDRQRQDKLPGIHRARDEEHTSPLPGLPGASGKHQVSDAENRGSQAGVSSSNSTGSLPQLFAVNPVSSKALNPRAPLGVGMIQPGAYGFSGKQAGPLSTTSLKGNPLAFNARGLKQSLASVAALQPQASVPVIRHKPELAAGGGRKKYVSPYSQRALQSFKEG
ncbi:hypothetical protein WJX72_003680 [[Myrmecia] bisecta]|uniref:Protein kinase domain-containing protein n=1 Tax=[Myrmecia] bisecta TaxID=41462 RepID=A0AAW1PCJ2_9CHLO